MGAIRRTVSMAFLLCLLSSAVLASPTGGGVTPSNLEGQNPWSFGGDVDIVFNRDLDEDRSEMNSNWFGGRVSVDTGDRVHFNAFMGVASVDVDSIPLTVGSTLELEGGTGFGIGLNTKVDLYEFWLAKLADQARLWMSGGWRFHTADVDEAKRGGTGASSQDFSIDFNEWYVAIGLSQPMGNFVPYAAIKYSDVNIQVDGTGTFPGASVTSVTTLNSDNLIGIALGFDWFIFNNVAFNLEGRFIDEEALYLSLHSRW